MAIKTLATFRVIYYTFEVSMSCAEQVKGRGQKVMKIKPKARKDTWNKI